jgi:hypothetical protein
MGIEAHSASRENWYGVARLSFESLVSDLSSPSAHVMSHSELEGLLHDRGLELLRQLLQGHLDQRGPGESLEPIRSAEGVVLTHERWGRGRGWESLFGSVSVTRVGYGARDESMVYPLDGDLNLPQERYSLGVRKRVAQEAVRGSFDEAVTAVVTTTGAHVPKRQAEELVVRAATDFDAFYREAEVVDEGATGTILVLSVDGKGVVMRQEHLREATRKVAAERQSKLVSKLTTGEKRGAKRMATVAAVYTIAPYARTPEQVVAQIMERLRLESPKRPRPENKRVWASLEKEPKAVVAEVFEEALQRDPDQRRDWVALVDGNLTQLDLLQTYSRQHRVELTIVVDVMHVLSYVWKASHAFHDAGSKESENWVSERLQEILQGRAGLVAGGMRRSATFRNLAEEDRLAVDKCADYLLKYKRFLRYDAALAAGFPISSGVIEGTCRHLINDRMDRTGARWGLNGAEAVLRLRSITASGDFDDYWRYHERQERDRNHLARYADGIPSIRRHAPRALPKPRLRAVK